MKSQSNSLTRRRLFIGAGGMVSVLALAACGAMPAATTAPEAEAEAEAPKAKEAMPEAEIPVISIDEYFTESDGRHAPYLATLDLAEEELNVKFNVIPGEYSGIWDRRKTAFAAGEADVDISMNQVNWVFFGGFNGMFIDHIPLMQRDNIDISRYYPADIKAWSWAGKLYAIPTQSGGELVLFNKQYFDEAGLNYPGGDWTYDDMIDMCQKVHKPDDNRWAVRIGQNSLFYMASTFMLNFGGEELTEDGNKVLYGDDTKAHAGAQFNVDLHLKHQFTPPREVVRELLAGPFRHRHSGAGPHRHGVQRRLSLQRIPAALGRKAQRDPTAAQRARHGHRGRQRSLRHGSLQSAGLRVGLPEVARLG